MKLKKLKGILIDAYNKKIEKVLNTVDKQLLDNSMDKCYLFVDEFDNLADPIKSELNYPVGIAKNIEINIHRNLSPIK